MLRLLKKMRYRLLTEHRLSRYLLYAVGEITLVVIGILIALAINNWKEEKALAVKEEVYLNGLLNEFAISKKKLEVLISVNQENLEGALTIVKFMSYPDSLPSEKVISALLIKTFARELSFNPNNSLLLEMVSSGSLKDLSNNDLRKELTNWLATLEDISKQEQGLAKQRDNVFEVFRTGDFSIRTVFEELGDSPGSFELPPGPRQISNLGLLKSVAFENNVLLFVSTCKATSDNHYLPLMDDLNAIISLIENEVKERDR